MAGQAEGLVVEHRPHPLAVGLDAGQPGVVERRGQGVDRRGPVVAVGEHLGQQRVVVRADLGTGRHPRVDPHVGREGHLGEQAGRGQEALRRVLGVEPGFDGVAPGRRGAGGHDRRVARGDADHGFDQVEAGDQLGHAVLDLQPGVDLEEVVLVVDGVDEELDGPHRPVAHRRGQQAGRLGQAGAQRVGQGGCRRLLHDLLVAALDRAVAVAEDRHAAGAVADHLHLDVAGHGQEALGEQGGRAEVGGARPGGAFPGGGQLVGGVDPGHADAAAPGRGLEQEGVAQPLGLGGGLVQRGEHAAAGQQGSACGCGQPAGSVLVAEGLDLVGGGADEHQAGRLDPAGEVGGLGQEAVARVDRLGPAVERGLHHQVGPQVAAAGRLAARAPRRGRRRPRAPRPGRRRRTPPPTRCRGAAGWPSPGRRSRPGWRRAPGGRGGEGAPSSAAGRAAARRTGRCGSSAGHGRVTTMRTGVGSKPLQGLFT